MEMRTFDKYDTETNALPNGDPRCERCTKYLDDRIEDFAWARCTSPATLRVRATYPDGKVKEANACRQCYEDFLPHVGEVGYPAKIEALTELPGPGPDFVSLTPEQIAKVKL
jgi:hypothetical protein